MRKYYYLEIKQYSHTVGGYDYQLGDGGEIPSIYKYLDKAIAVANHMIDFQVDEMGYEIVIPNETNPARKDDCKFAVRLQNKQRDIRKEIRIYAMTINNDRLL